MQGQKVNIYGYVYIIFMLWKQPVDSMVVNMHEIKLPVLKINGYIFPN